MWNVNGVENANILHDDFFTKVSENFGFPLILVGALREDMPAQGSNSWSPGRVTP
jgi:hypothetical protein